MNLRDHVNKQLEDRGFTKEKNQDLPNLDTQALQSQEYRLWLSNPLTCTFLIKQEKEYEQLLDTALAQSHDTQVSGESLRAKLIKADTIRKMIQYARSSAS